MRSDNGENNFTEAFIFQMAHITADLALFSMPDESFQDLRPAQPLL